MGRYYDWYEPTTPKEVKGGIKAHSKRGSFVKSWWGKRWIETLESFDIGARLSRGRSYARKGQVATLEIDKGKVISEVQGSEIKPYIVSIKLEAYTAKNWDKIISSLLGKPIFAAQLLGNEMPHDIEAVFEGMGVPLFPERQKDLETNCTCPDWSNPCKHIAAVFYIMAEAFDNDPFLIFKLRGMGKQKLIKKLTESGKNKEGGIQEIMPEPLKEEQNIFWGQKEDYDIKIDINSPSVHAPLPKRLGLLPFWRSSKNFISIMETYYKEASCHGKNLIEKF